MKKLALLVSTLLISSLSFAGWEKGNEANYYNYNHNGSILSIALGIPHQSQPTNYTCGATTTSMSVTWEIHKNGQSGSIDIRTLYNIMNTEGGEESGIQTTELKNGLARVFDFLYQRGYTSNVKFVEEGKSEVLESVKFIHEKMNNNKSPAFLYGNVKGGSAGMHYYVASGTLYCPKSICGSETGGLYLLDSAYKSPAFEGSLIGNNALSPRKYVSSNELPTYWKKTGSFIESLRKHNFLYNKSGY